MYNIIYIGVEKTTLGELFAMKTFDRRVDDFFLGYGYPIFSFALILFGYLTGLEVFTILINCIVTAFAILKTDNVKPLLFFVLTFMYQLTPWHLPMKPYNSAYYYTGFVPYVLISAVLIIVVSVIVFIFKSHLLSYVSWGSVPMLVPLVAFSIAMLLNGAFAEGYEIMNLVWGIGQVLVYLVIYLICYLGLRREKRYELLDYLQLVVILMSWILIVQVVHCLGTAFANGTLFTENGEISRSAVSLGFGNCNIVGVHTAMLIPANLVGLASGRRPYTSLVTAILIYLCALSTTSRNAMLFGSIFFFGFVAVALIKHIHGRGFKLDFNRKSLIFAGSTVAVTLVVVLIFREQIFSLVDTVSAYYQKMGMSDNGRYDLWRKSYEFFLESPVFGKGFYTIDLSTPNSFAVLLEKFNIELVPDFAHNTVFELLGATGIMGFLAYSVYRISSLVVAFRHSSFERLLWVVAALYVAVASIVDNFVFQIFSPVLYTVIMAVIANVYDSEMQWFKKQNHSEEYLKIYEAKLKELKSKNR